MNLGSPDPAPPASPPIEVNLSTLPRFEPPEEGLFAAAALWGFFGGLAEALITVGIDELNIWTTSLTLWLSLSLLAFLSPIAVSGWGLVSPSWRARWVAAAAPLFGAGFWAMMLALMPVRRPETGPLIDAFRTQWSYLPGAVALITAASWLAIYALRRTRYLRALRRAPSRCYGCGYNLAGLDAEATCPECGRDRRQHPGPARWAIPPGRIRRRLLIFAAVLVVAGPAVYTLRWWREVVPQMRLLGSLGSTEFADLPGPTGEDSATRPRGRGVVVRLKDGSSRALYVVLPRGRMPGLPAVRIWLADMRPMGESLPLVYAHRLSPPVICDLDTRQADELFRRGLPASLVDAMSRAGAASKTDEMWIDADDLAATPPTAIRIDPAPHLR